MKRWVKNYRKLIVSSKSGDGKLTSAWKEHRTSIQEDQDLASTQSPSRHLISLSLAFLSYKTVLTIPALHAVSCRETQRAMDLEEV